MATKSNDGNWVTEPISPYRLATVLSDVVGRTIQPQRLYGDVRQDEEGNARLTTRLSETGHKIVDPDDANAYILDFMDRATKREASKVAKAEEAAATEAEAAKEAAAA